MLELAPGQPKTTSWLKAKTNTPATFIIGGLCGLLVGYVVFSSNLALAPAKNNEDLSDQDTVPADISGSPSLSSPASQNSFAASLDSQLPGPVVFIKHIEMKDDGWLAVHTDQNGAPSPNILGALYLKAGTYDSQTVSLLKGTTDGNHYWLVAHTDDGDHSFDYQLDLPRRDEKGNIEAVKFSVAAESSRGD